MTVAELIDQLEAMDPEAVVYLDWEENVELREAEWLVLDQIVRLS